MTRQDRTELADQLRDAAALLESGAMAATRAKITHFILEFAKREGMGRARSATGESLKDFLGKWGIKVDWTLDE